MGRQLEAYEQMERSLIKQYRKRLWNPFIYGVKRYELVRSGDRIAVCISGGKDSFVMAKLMQELHRHSDVPFDALYLAMDPGYSAANRRKIEENAALLRIPVTIFSSDIFSAANASEKNPCYLCARMRRGTLYKKARELGCNKIALGHHFNDVIETTVMGMFYGSQLQGMMPKLHSTNFPGMELVRPLYCVHEDDIIAWGRHWGLDFLQCACRFTERAEKGEASGEGGEKSGAGGGKPARNAGLSKRKEIKLLLRRLKEANPNIEKSVFQSIHNLSLDTFPAYKTKGAERSFLETYDNSH